MKRVIALSALLLSCATRPVPEAAVRVVPLPVRPRATASADFWRRWGDGRAELASYDVLTPRYGELRPAELVLITVTEPLDRRTLVKDDDVPEAQRLNVLKLNVSLKFETGVYPYSVMTSVFATVDDYGLGRFAPVKLTLTAQEWCGHVFEGVWPSVGRFFVEERSYFAGEGDRDRVVPVAAGTLYEDALLLQLRELDGAFHEGRDWEGTMVMSLWRGRRAHQPLGATAATIRRVRTVVDGVSANAFTMTAAGFTRTYEVSTEGDHAVLGWRSSDGEVVRLRRSARLAYWTLNHEADRVPTRTQLGLDARARESAATPQTGVTPGR